MNAASHSRNAGREVSGGADVRRRTPAIAQEGQPLSGFSRLRGPILAASSLLGGALGLQLGSFGLPLAAWTGAVVLGAVGALMAALVWLDPRGRQRLLFGLLACIALSFIINPQAVLGAWATVANGFILSWDAMTESLTLPFRTGDGVGVVGLAAVALCFASMSSLVVWVTLRLRASALALGVCAAVALAAVFADAASLLSVGSVMGAGVLTASLLSMVKRQTGGANRLSVRGFLAMVPPLAVALVLMLGVAFAVAGGIGNWSGATGVRADLIESFDEARFGSDTLPEGEFAKASGMNRVGEGEPAPRLELTFASPTEVERSYLRGYVGTSYTGTSFSSPAVSAYDGQWNGLFDWLRQAGFDPLLQSAQYVQVNCAVAAQQAPASSMTIKAREANRRYAYVPYQAMQVTSTQPLLDISLQPSGFFGLEESALSIVPDSQATESFTPAEWVTSPLEDPSGEESTFLQAERAYRAFVYDTYLSGAEESAEAIQTFFFTGEGWDPATSDLYSIATRIRSMLESRCTFTAAPPSFAASGSRNYVNWFLEDERQGNASAFAAAATLAFREAGVPARYVEGYLLSQANSDALREAGQATATLTAREAHAWVEVYVDGVGWTPLEMTPGFYDKAYAAEQTIEVSKEVAGDGSDSDLSGSLDRSWDDWIPDELRPFAWIGLLLLAAIVVLACFGLLELQRLLRVRLRARRFAEAVQAATAPPERVQLVELTAIGETRVSSLLFDRLMRALRFAPTPFDASWPRRYADEVERHDLGMTPFEYQRMIELIERERFGGVPLNVHEITLIEDILVRLEAALWRGAPRRRRIVMRYHALFELPL